MNKIYKVPNHSSKDWTVEEIELAMAKMKNYVLSGFSLEQTQCKKLLAAKRKAAQV